MFYNNLEVACKVFSNKQDWKIRVVFGESGEPLFCGRDVAASMGYDAPGPAVKRFKGESVVAPIPWENTTRKGCTPQCCFTEAAMMDFINSSSVRPAPGFLQWVTSVVIPGAKAEAISHQLPHEPVRKEAPRKDATPSDIGQQIDDIIFGLMLLKKSLA